jgi:hypothetical protein
MGRKSHENRSKETAGGPESSFSLTRQAQTNHYDRRIQAHAQSLGVSHGASAKAPRTTQTQTQMSAHPPLVTVRLYSRDMTDMTVNSRTTKAVPVYQ